MVKIYIFIYSYSYSIYLVPIQSLLDYIVHTILYIIIIIYILYIYLKYRLEYIYLFQTVIQTWLMTHLFSWFNDIVFFSQAILAPHAACVGTNSQLNGGRNLMDQNRTPYLTMDVTWMFFRHGACMHFCITSRPFHIGLCNAEAQHAGSIGSSSRSKPKRHFDAWKVCRI